MIGRCVRAQGRLVAGAGPRINQKGDGQRQHDQQFQAAQECSDLHRQADTVAREHPDAGEGHQGNQPPRTMNPKLGLQCVRDQVAEETRGTGRSKEIVNQVAPCGHEAGAASETAGRKGVIAAARWQVARKLRHGIGDQQAHNRRQQKGKRHGGARLERDQREREHDVRGWRNVRNALENQFGQTERISPQLRIRSRVGGISGQGRSPARCRIS